MQSTRDRKQGQVPTATAGEGSPETDEVTTDYDPIHHTLYKMKIGTEEAAAASPRETKSGASGTDISEQAPVTSGVSGPEQPPVPGEHVGLEMKALDAGRKLMQSWKPLSGICEHVCGL
jgi:hypothetical protein